MQESTSLQAATHASHLAQQESEKAQMIPATYGLKCLELLDKQDPLGLCVKMLLGTSVWASTRCFLTWKESTTPDNRLLFQLVQKTRHTNESGCGLFSTPTALMPLESSDPSERIFKLKSGRLRKASKEGTTGSLNWSQERLHLDQLPTPELCESWMGYPIGWTDVSHSETQ